MHGDQTNADRYPIALWAYLSKLGMRMEKESIQRRGGTMDVDIIL